ncbi:MAG: hypothetical protein NZ802_04065 [Candidatus Poseidoniales archaeon]|nr:hypothetical protein [Candidatus Poseidoniales archaeon]
MSVIFSMLSHLILLPGINLGDTGNYQQVALLWRQDIEQMAVFSWGVSHKKMKIGTRVIAFLNFKALARQPFPHILLDVAGRHGHVAGADLFQRSEQIRDVFGNHQ